MYENDIASDTIDIMDVWAVYFQEGENRIRAEIALDEIIEDPKRAPDVMADMGWLFFIPEGDVESTLASGSSEAGDWLGKESWQAMSRRMARFLQIRDGSNSSKLEMGPN